MDISFDISNAPYECYDDIMAFFNSGKNLYFGERKRKSGSSLKFFANYVAHRMLIRRSATNHTIIGYAEVTNYPYIPALPEDCWMDWIKFHYCITMPLSVTNTCFFNTFIYRKDCNPELLRQVLFEVFYREPKLSYIIVARCPKYGFEFRVIDVPNYYCLEQFASVLYPKCFSTQTHSRSPRLYVMKRNDIIPVMRYRKALPEDNDDIVGIVENDRPDIKEKLGDYYIAEELLADSKSFFIVTEIHHVTSGFIWLNDDINIFKLLENYDLEKFGNLLKYNSKQIFKKNQFFITTSERRPLNEIFVTEFLSNIYREDVLDFSLDSLAPSDSQDSNETICKPKSYLIKMAKLVTVMKDSAYFIDVRKKKYAVYYNIGDVDDLEGKSNAFVIQLFGLVGAHDVRRLYRFLLTSFSAYPDKDYCLLSLCVSNPITACLFEMLKHFIRVPTRPGCRIDEQLYITHRCTIYGELSLYPVRQEDVVDIQNILSEKTFRTSPTPKQISKFRFSSISFRVSVGAKSFINSEEELDPINQNDLDYILEILKNIFQDPFSKYKCLTIRCGDSTRPIDDNTLVGFAIVRPFNSKRLLHKHFYIHERYELNNLTLAELVVLKLHPLFHSQSDVVFRELARQTNFWHFFHFRTTNLHCLPNDLLLNMKPVEPRRTKRIWFGKFHESPAMQTGSSVSLNGSDGTLESDSLETNENNIDFINDRFASFEHNLGPSEFMGHATKIVVLGFSDICKAFLRLMIFSWHNNGQYNSINCLPHLDITVICAPGIMEAEYEYSFKCNTCDNEEDCWVNFQNCDDFIKDVRDRMDVRSWIRFISGDVSSIDTDNQMIVMESNCEIFYESLLLMCTTEFGVPKNMFEYTRIPPNYSHINNRRDKLIFYHKLKILNDDFAEEVQKSIVVYGSHIKAFEFVNFLIKHGIKGNEIHFVMPFNTAHAELDLVYNNPTIDLRVESILRDMLEDLSVTIYDRMNFTKCSFHNDDINIKDVSFLSHNGQNELTLQCDLFVSFYETYIAAPVLEILKEGNLHIDQDYVIVDNKYETSVSNIFAIGNFIKHKRDPNHQYWFVSPQEAARKIMIALDADILKFSSSAEVRKFSEPFYFQAELPMDHFFVKVTSPKRYLANHLNNEYGFPLVTYYDGDFSRVRLSELGMVEEIVVVTKKKMNYDFLKFFCGRHELLLNNLKSRWYLKDIVSFIDFFQEQWVELLMHDQFESLRMLNKLLISPTAQEIIRKNVDRETKLKLVRFYCQDMGIASQLEFALVEFVREHRHDFTSHIALPEDFPLPNKATKYY